MERYATALYGRTSPHDRKKITIESQQKALREWSIKDEQVSSVAGEYWDATVSGKVPLWDRPEGARLMADIDSGKVAAVAVLFIDRLGRTSLDSLQAAAQLENKGVRLVAVADGWDARKEDDPLYFQIRAAIAESEHRRIRDRMQRGKAMAIERDNAPPGGSLIFGYRMGPHGEFVVDPIEAAIVKEVFRRIDGGSTYLEVLAWIQSTGIAAGRRFQARKATEAKIITTHAKARWHHGRIGLMLRQRAYIGERAWKDRVFPCPRLIDQDVWDRVQARIGNWTRRYYTQRENGLCSALLRCAVCGYRYYYSRSRPTSRNAYYVCLGKKHGRCPSPRPLVTEIDAVVWSKVREYLEDPARILREAVLSCGSADTTIAELDAAERDLQSGLDALDAEASEIQSANAEMPFAWILPRLEALNKKRKTLLEQQKSLRSRRAAVQLDKAGIEKAVEMLRIDGASVSIFTPPEQRREIVRQHVSELTLGKDKQLHISFRWGCGESLSSTNAREITLALVTVHLL